MQTPKKKQQERASAFLDTIPELKDETRMRYLFSNFPQRESNPKKWEDLRSFWTKVIYPSFNYKIKN